MLNADWQVYLLECSDGSLYCGVTKDIQRRLAEHNEGTASKYTRSRTPVKIVALKEGLMKREAFQLEYRIKKLPPGKKIQFLMDAGVMS